MFIHVVLFWLKKDAPAGARDQMLKDCQDYLAKIPSGRHTWFGRPAMTPREVVDNTYDIGLCCAYDDVAGHDEYQAHPLHKEFVARNKPNWDRIQVYDFK